MDDLQTLKTDCKKKPDWAAKRILRLKKDLQQTREELKGAQRFSDGLMKKQAKLYEELGNKSRTIERVRDEWIEVRAEIDGCADINDLLERMDTAFGIKPIDEYLKEQDEALQENKQ